MIEILIQIFTYLPSIFAMSCVCQRFNQISMEPSFSHHYSHLFQTPYVSTKEAQDYSKLLSYEYIELEDKSVAPNMSELFDKFVRKDVERAIASKESKNKPKKKKWFNVFFKN